MNLRTLKDLRGFWMPNQVKAKRYRMVEESELRQEAINHINHMRAEISDFTARDELNSNIKINSLAAQIGWIKKFFNISEDDLQ